MKPTLAVILNTARPDFPYVGIPETFIFSPTIRSLAAQTEPPEQLIIVDALKSDPERAKRLQQLINQIQPPFTVSHVEPESPLFPDYVTICAAKNTGLLHVLTDTILFSDDGAEFPPHTFALARDYLERGFWPSFMCHYAEAGQPTRAPDKSPPLDQIKGNDGFDVTQSVSGNLWGAGAYVRDSRYTAIDKAADGVLCGTAIPADWWRGYTAAPTHEILAVDGFDVAFDGDKSLEDPDMGIRMALRFGQRLAIDRRLWVIEHRGGHYDPRAVRLGGTLKCNYALLQASVAAGRWRATKRPRREIDTTVDVVCSTCNNLNRCRGERLGGLWRPPNQTPDEVSGYERWLKENTQ